MRYGTKISVIIPVFNAEEYIRECLDSVINQTFRNIEIICVDDGSTDKSLEILDRYAVKDERFKILRQTNMYAGVARNNGLKIAQGEYVIFLDADDIFEEDMLEVMYLQAEQHDLDIAICDFLNFDNETGNIMEIKQGYVTPETQCVFSNMDFPNDSIQIFGMIPWNKLFKRKFILCNEIWFQPTKTFNDNYFVFIALSLAKRMMFINRKFIKHRINNAKSLQGGKDEEGISDLHKALSGIKVKLLAAGLADVFQKQFLNQYLSCVISLLFEQDDYEKFKRGYEKTRQLITEELEINEHESKFWYSERYYLIAKDICILDIVHFLHKYFVLYEHTYNAYATYFRHTLPEKVLKGCKKIVIYGAGIRGKAYMGQMINNPVYKVVAWLDKNYQGIDMGCIQIQAPETIISLEYDRVLVAVEDEDIKKEIKKSLILLGVEENKIVE